MSKIFDKVFHDDLYAEIQNAILNKDPLDKIYPKFKNCDWIKNMALIHIAAYTNDIRGFKLLIDNGAPIDLKCINVIFIARGKLH